MKYITAFLLVLAVSACKDTTAPDCGINGECHDQLAGSWSGSTAFVAFDITISNIGYGCTTGFEGGHNCTTTGNISGTARGVTGQQALRGSVYGSGNSFNLYLSLLTSVEAAAEGCAPNLYTVYITTVSAKRLTADVVSSCAGGIIVRHEALNLRK